MYQVQGRPGLHETFQTKEDKNRILPSKLCPHSGWTAAIHPDPWWSTDPPLILQLPSLFHSCQLAPHPKQHH